MVTFRSRLVYFPFQEDEYTSSFIDLQKEVSISLVRFFSFEMKINLNFSSIRESYFQAVSNSSWANEGYLVALNINKESDFLQEPHRLADAFGIGIIELDAENVAESKILIRAKENKELDWNTLNRLAEKNGDFGVFLKDIVKDLSVCCYWKIRFNSFYRRVICLDKREENNERTSLTFLKNKHIFVREKQEIILYALGIPKACRSAVVLFFDYYLL